MNAMIRSDLAASSLSCSRGRRFLRVLLPLLLVSKLECSADAATISSFGIMAVEESDDRQRPGVQLHLGFDSFALRYFRYGRAWGPVVEETSLFSVAHLVPLPSFSPLTASVGAAFLAEKTHLDFAEPDSDSSFTQVQYNAGLFLGLSLPVAWSQAWQTELGWHAALFPAGISGGLLLATARKQFLSLSLGYRW